MTNRKLIHGERMKLLITLLTLTLLSFNSFAQEDDDRPDGSGTTLSSHGGTGVVGGSGGSTGPSVTGNPGLPNGKVINANILGNSPSSPATQSRREYCCMKCAGNKTHLNKSIVNISSKPFRCQSNDNSLWKLKSLPQGRCINGPSAINYLGCGLSKN